MANLYSLHVGMNDVDASKYPDFPWRLHSCFTDMHTMAEIARHYGAKRTIELKNASVEEFTSNLRELARLAAVDDLVFITYSGHGAWVPDVTGEMITRILPRRTAGGGPIDFHPTILLWDRMLLADEWADIWGTFAAAVRVITMFDSCVSGSADLSNSDVLNYIIKSPLATGEPNALAQHFVNVTPQKTEPIPLYLRDAWPRLTPREAVAQIYTMNKDLYDKIQQSTRKFRTFDLQGLHFAACTDREVALEDMTGKGGYFTRAVKELLMPDPGNGSSPSATYRALHEALGKRLERYDQHPPVSAFGKAAKSAETKREILKLGPLGLNPWP